jgi:CMP-N-acetylneuraminic acid synthetase
MIPESVMMLTNFNHLIPYMQYDEKKNSRQLKPKYYCRNGAAIYIMTRNCLMEKGSLFGNATVAYFMDKISSIDIDDMEDWIIAESILQKKECL